MPVEKDGIDMSLDQNISLFQNGDAADKINFPVDTFREATRECFTYNRTKWLKDTANAWMNYAGVMTDEDIIWIMQNSKVENITWNKGEMDIVRVTKNGSYEFFNTRLPYGTMVKKVFVDSLEPAYVYDGVAWALVGCKNPCEDNRPIGPVVSVPDPNRQSTGLTPGVDHHSNVIDIPGGGRVQTMDLDSMTASGTHTLVLYQPIIAGNNNGNISGDIGNGSVQPDAAQGSFATATQQDLVNHGYQSLPYGAQYYSYCEPGGYQQYCYSYGNQWYYAGGGLIAGYLLGLLQNSYLYCYNHGCQSCGWANNGSGGVTVVNNNYNNNTVTTTGTGNPNPTPNPTTGGPYNPPNGGNTTTSTGYAQNTSNRTVYSSPVVTTVGTATTTSAYGSRPTTTTTTTTAVIPRPAAGYGNHPMVALQATATRPSVAAPSGGFISRH
jgi:hypothetical protein